MKLIFNVQMITISSVSSQCCSTCNIGE